MSKQIFNPILPLNTYIADPEPHIFGDRVYIYGSHDKEGGETFCMLGYEIWSAPLDDLTAWSSKGINYRAEQDPLCKGRKEPYIYAPDCVKGNDGKYYLYYCLGGYAGPVGVAVCDTPDGKYEFYGHVRNQDGNLLRRFIPFDPGVINDDGIIRLYYGAWYPFNEMPQEMSERLLPIQSQMFEKSVEEIKSEKGGIFGPVTCVLDSDMLTVVGEPVRIFPAVTKNTPFESRFIQDARPGEPKMSGHGFFEASSIRKIAGKYYFIYSSVNNHELCYAVSEFPDRDFVYGGTIISNGDVGYKGREPKDRLNATGTNHGSLVKLNGQWYIFYHRLTHGSDFSRQVCAEPVQILPDGNIPQVEMTSCGLNGKPLIGKGTYPAAICCNLSDGKMPHGARDSRNLPRVTHENEECFLTDLTENVVIAYKYFDLTKTTSIVLTARRTGIVDIYFGEKKVIRLGIDGGEWKDYRSATPFGEARDVLRFKILSGKIEIISFELGE